MKTKKLSSVFTVFGMALAMIAGLAMPQLKVKAAVTAKLPEVPGLYVSDEFRQDWDQDPATVLTDTDASGNTILVDEDGKPVDYRDQDNPDYLTEGIKEDWGEGFENEDHKWFDYIADGKVTHVGPSDLEITHLDGTPCDHITVTADEDDARIAVFHVTKLEKVKISYKGATVNNAMIGEFFLGTGFYSSTELSLATQITDRELNLANGKSKDLYFHLTEEWEQAGFRLNPDTAASLTYWDQEKDEEAELTGEAVKDYVTLTPVSTDDPHHLIYKVTAQGKTPGDHWYRLRLSYIAYNQEDPSDQRDDNRDIHFEIQETNVLYAAEPDALTVKGDRYVYPNKVNFNSQWVYVSAGSPKSPIYLLLKYSDEDGNLIPVTDPSKLTFYHSGDDDEKGTDVYTKVDSSVIKAEKAYADSDIIKISYQGTIADFGNQYAISYDGAEPIPDSDNRIELSFVPALFNEAGTYTSTVVSDSSQSREIQTDGTKDAVIYAATADFSSETPWNQIQSASFDKVTLKDENGNDLSSKVIIDKNTTMTEESGHNIVFGAKITIPQGTLSASAKMVLDVSLKSLGGDGNLGDYTVSCPVYIFYSKPEVKPADQPTSTEKPGGETKPAEDPTTDTAPVKGTTAVVGGHTYKVTSVGKTKTATLTKGKKNVKSVTVPATVKIKGVSFKVTAIGVSAFSGNKKMTKATLGNNLTTIGASAFSGNTKMTSVVLDKNVKTIGKKVFNGCTKLKSITIKGTALKSVGGSAFAKVPKKCKAKVPKKKVSAYKKLLKKGGYKGTVSK